MLYAVAFITGFLASLGVGGGMILLVYLTLFENVSQIEAQGINLVFFLPIAALAVVIHYKNGLIKLKPLLWAIAAGTLSALAGAAAAEFLGSEILRRLYGAFLIILGIKTFTKKNKR